MVGKKPSTASPKDMRLKANKTAGTKTAGTAASKQPPMKFGSPAWRSKYGK